MQNLWSCVWKYSLALTSCQVKSINFTCEYQVKLSALLDRGDMWVVLKNIQFIVENDKNIQIKKCEKFKISERPSKNIV